MGKKTERTPSSIDLSQVSSPRVPPPVFSDIFAIHAAYTSIGNSGSIKIFTGRRGIKSHDGFSFYGSFSLPMFFAFYFFFLLLVRPLQISMRICAVVCLLSIKTLGDVSVFQFQKCHIFFPTEVAVKPFFLFNREIQLENVG